MFVCDVQHTRRAASHQFRLTPPQVDESGVE
jgi:hypothetical protein